MGRASLRRSEARKLHSGRPGQPWSSVDVVPDSSPIIGESPLPNLFLNCGWGTGGFKAIPAGGTLFAHLLATGKHHEISRPFDLGRFRTGRLVDEAAGSGIAH